MSVDNINTLVQVTIEVLEGYAFMLGDPLKAGDEAVRLADPSWIVTITFAGPRVGAIGMIASLGLARQVAANLYGVELAQVSNEQAQGAVKGLLIIVCGNYVHKVEGNEPFFDLTAPAQRAVARAQARQYVEDKPQTMLVVEGHPLLLFIEN